jgi:hypothetical protein
VVITVPNIIKVRSTNYANPCINNLRQLNAAANQFNVITFLFVERDFELLLPI